MLATLFATALLLVPAAPPDDEGAVIKPERRVPAPAAPTAPPAPARDQPPPDRDDKFDAPVPITLGPSPEESLLGLEQDLPGLAAQAAVGGAVMTACWAVPGAAVAGGTGGVGVLVALLVPAAWPLAVLLPLATLPFLAPGCLVVVPVGSVLGSLVGSLFTGRRGPVLQPALAAVGAGLLLGVVVAAPLLAASAGLAVGGLLLLPAWLARMQGQPLSPLQSAWTQAFVVAAVAHPLLAALWTLAAGGATRFLVGAVSAAVYRALGRRLDPVEDVGFDLWEVAPPPPEALPARPPPVH
ncbi:MAG: hypothetical protein HY904_21045 [Deltaproteobacteria bacterium]|nr:hypothetical protein [Deltaproteobacteria bacterium]